MMSEYSRLTKSEIINFERSVNPSSPAPLPPPPPKKKMKAL